MPQGKKGPSALNLLAVKVLPNEYLFELGYMKD